MPIFTKQHPKPKNISLAKIKRNFNMILNQMNVKTRFKDDNVFRI